MVNKTSSMVENSDETNRGVIKMEREQINKLSDYLKQMDEILEKILHAQFRIQNKKWLQAITKIEDGFQQTVGYIADVKGIEIKSKIMTNEDINKILEG